MIQPRTIQRAIEDKFLVAQLQALAHRQHRVGVVLLHGEYLGILRDIAQGIKIPQDAIGLQPQFLQVGKSPIRSQNIVVLFDWQRQLVEATGAEDHAACHGLTPSFHFFYLTIIFPETP